MTALDQAKAWLTAHKGEATLGGAAAGVVGLALYERHRKTRAGTSTAAASGLLGAAGVDASGNPTVTYPATAGIVSPNTSMTDIQNAVQDQLNQALSGFAAQLPGAGTSTASAPSGPVTDPSKAQFYYGDAAKGLKYIQDLSNWKIYQIGPTGVPYWLSPLEYAALGNPGYSTFGERPGAPAPAPKPAPSPAPARAPITGASG